MSSARSSTRADHQLVGAAQDLGPLAGRGRGPGGLRGAGRVEGGERLGGAGGGDLGEHLARGRVVDGQ